MTLSLTIQTFTNHLFSIAFSSVSTGVPVSLGARRKRKSVSAHSVVYASSSLASSPMGALQVSLPFNRSSKAERIARQLRKQGNAPARLSGYTAAPKRSSRRSLVDKAEAQSVDHAIKTQPCFYFTKYGYCFRGEDCFYLHTPEDVALCDAFIKGRCTTNSCMLRHVTSYALLPVCHHFLQSNCLDAQCPYPHCKYASDAQICLEFQHGNCSIDSNCKNIHSFVCAEFYATKGTLCSNQARCPYQHPANLGQAVNTVDNSKPGQGSRSVAKEPCKYLQRGFCARGESCFYSHDFAIETLSQATFVSTTAISQSSSSSMTKMESAGLEMYEDTDETITEVDTSREGRDADVSDFEVTREHYRPPGVVSVVIKREPVSDFSF